MFCNQISESQQEKSRYGVSGARFIAQKAAQWHMKHKMFDIFTQENILGKIAHIFRIVWHTEQVDERRLSQAH